VIADQHQNRMFFLLVIKQKKHSILVLNFSTPVYLTPLEFLKDILPLRDRGNCTNFAVNSRSCRRILMKVLSAGIF